MIPPANHPPRSRTTPAADRHYFDFHDIELARQVERLLFPRSSPVCTWCCIGVKNRMAGILGGDYFDFITMPDGCQTLFLGDVTGHGLHASVVMSLLYGFIHHATLGSCDPLRLVDEVNTFLLRFARRAQGLDQFFSSTLFFGIIDPQTLTMRYVNAGQVPGLVLRNGQVMELATTAWPLGYFDSPQIGSAIFRFEPGDRLLLYTDGITEAPNGAGERFGTERLKTLLVEDGADHMEFLERLFAALHRFGTSDPPEDDCTAIVADIRGGFIPNGTGGGTEGT
ncbi:MAG TPA: PP2C family protein-serine/threonine phosphatase [Desulfuromonadaceae bacterium]